MNKEKLHVVCLSGGKDSTAMLLMMLEKNMPVDIVLFCDTGIEFPAMYEHIDKIEKYIGIPITRLKADKSFEYYLIEHEVNYRPTSEKYGTDIKGYGWAGARSRWCTSELKTRVISGYLKDLKREYDVIEYVGIAADEPSRIKNLRYPLYEWGITEAKALEYCYSKGFDFGGLYKLFNRASCWCCPLQGLKALRTLHDHFPDLWQQLKIWDAQTCRQFRADYSVAELEARFAFEDARVKAGLPLRGKEFYESLYRELERKQND